MKDLWNKGLIFLLCSYFFIQSHGLSLSGILIILAALTICSLCSYFEHPVILVLLCWCLCLMSLTLEASGLFLPLLAYDALRHFRKLTLPPVLVCSCCTCIGIPDITFPFLLILFLSGTLSIYCQYMDNLYQELHRIRDEGRERTIVLRQRNQALIEKQNADIHAATLAERNRIARDIHDNVGHMLTRSILQMGALKVINKNPALDEPIQNLQDTLNTAMTSVRTSVHDLHDDAIDLSGVIEEIITAVTTPVITLEYDMGSDIPREIKYAFIAIVKEAVQNMQKHSNAAKAQIRMRKHPGFFLLYIADNGTNINLHTTNGIGLSNMKERIRNLGGTIRFDTENGFKISIMIRR